MREAEVSYWDEMARDRVLTDGGIIDNPVKRIPMARAMFGYSWAGHRVLEIGIGSGLTAAAINLLTTASWSYLGTDLSVAFCENARRWGLKAVQADVTKLPGKDGEYTRIIALDSLEHVRPEDRAAGYKEIARVTAKGGVMFINIPKSESHHEDEFDHGFGVQDLLMLESEGFALETYDTYRTAHPFLEGQTRAYAMAILKK